MNPFNIAARLSAEAKRLAMLNGDFDSDDDDDGMDGVASTGAGGKRTIDEVKESSEVKSASAGLSISPHVISPSPPEVNK
ncbi:hypothetical protein PHLCEN_2v11814 [Hermanssonia centrifuga]|uniref:Uncharacterized protein n=1 Tax=Hermanssonia centrifuga TaxID=98765 RepID=A0A2R6NIX9_9APHY|nr:hypothetical protein PHLCEN_2v11814 [Hermanssonia centrifuga]